MENIEEGEETGRFGLRRGRKAEGEGKRGGGRREREGRGREGAGKLVEMV